MGQFIEFCKKHGEVLNENEMKEYSDRFKTDAPEPLTKIMAPLDEEQVDFIQKLVTETPAPDGVIVSGVGVDKGNGGVRMIITSLDNHFETRNKINVRFLTPIQGEIFKRFPGITLQGGMNPTSDSTLIGAYLFTKPHAE